MKHRIVFWIARRLPRRVGVKMLKVLGYRFNTDKMVMGIIS